MESENVLDAVKRLRPTCYKYNDKIPELDDGVQHFGFIAQELEEIFPTELFGVVTEDERGNKMVRYHEIIPLLVKYIHHLEERVSKLENVENDNEL